jgi:hypothetical protein
MNGNTWDVPALKNHYGNLGFRAVVETKPFIRLRIVAGGQV